jgi:hypothetical protein
VTETINPKKTSRATAVYETCCSNLCHHNTLKKLATTAAYSPVSMPTCVLQGKLVLPHMKTSTTILFATHGESFTTITYPVCFNTKKILTTIVFATHGHSFISILYPMYFQSKINLRTFSWTLGGPTVTNGKQKGQQEAS